MVGLTDGEKNFKDMYNRLHTIPACDGQTDRRTDRQTDGHTDVLPRHSPRYACASRGKNHDFQSISHFIWEMMQDRAKVTREGE